MSRKQRKNSAPPYPVTFHKDNNFYNFDTDQHIEYTCIFDEVTRQVSPVLGIYDMEVYQFILAAHDPAQDTRKSQDPRIASTVTDLLQEYFANPSRVLLYLCAGGDGRAKQRQALFGQWHKNFADIINRDEVMIRTEDTIIYGGILTHKDFEHMDVLQRELFHPDRGIHQKFS